MKAEENQRPRLNWKRADWQSMKVELAAVNWEISMRSKTTEEMWAMLRSKVDNAVKKYVPIRKVWSRRRPAWLSPEIMAAIRRKQRLWRSAKKGKNVEDYGAADKEVKRLIRNAKRNFEKRLACQNGGNSRPFYAYIKQRTKTRPSMGPLKNANKENVSEDQGMAELLNNFFSSVFTREDTEHIPRAADMETIGPKLLQELVNELNLPLVLIFRKSLNTGEVPMELKSANVTPIFKKGTRSEPGN